MQSDYPERFERDVGCSEAEWLGWMPRAIGAHAWRQAGSSITVELPGGRLTCRTDQFYRYHHCPLGQLTR